MKKFLNARTDSKCPFCINELDAEASVCTNCGAERLIYLGYGSRVFYPERPTNIGVPHYFWFILLGVILYTVTYFAVILISQGYFRGYSSSDLFSFGGILLLGFVLMFLKGILSFIFLGVDIFVKIYYRSIDPYKSDGVIWKRK